MTLFLYISLLSLHNDDVKMPNFTFYRGRKQATTNFVSPSEHDLDMAPRNLAAGLGSPKFDKVSGNNRDKD